MKIDKTQMSSILIYFDDYKHLLSKNGGTYRKGQFIWNMLNTTKQFNPITEPYRASQHDPFYLDERIPLFMQLICDEEALQLWYESEFYKKEML